MVPRTLLVFLYLTTTLRPLAAEEPKPAHTPARALAAGVEYLVKRQSADGAWRSDVYGTFKDGPALTPLVVFALQSAGGVADLPGAENRKRAVRKGSEYLAALVRADGTVDEGETGLDYPVYTAAYAVMALSHPDNKELIKARDGWLKFLLERQLTEKLGWEQDTKEFGGWGYCRVVPRKPDPNRISPPLIESNLSATATALDALRAAGVTDKEVYRKALVFVSRCQNYQPADSPAPKDGRPTDGGFFFIYDDPVRNKAGTVNPPDTPARHFHSYGSTTADGVRALLRCGLPLTDPRVKAGQEWLVRHYKPDTHPGTYVANYERNREAVYFYYAASLAQTFRDLGEKEWAGPLCKEIARRQKDDGSWANPVDLVRENDPVVATAKAIVTLATGLRP